MQVTTSLPTSFVVVLLDDLWIGGELVEKGEALAVDRAVRNDWIGSKLARDATADELEQYRAEEAEAAAEAAAEAEEKAKADAAAAKKAGK